MILKFKLKTITYAFLSCFFLLSSPIQATSILQSNENSIQLIEVIMKQNAISLERADIDAQIVVRLAHSERVFFKVHYGFEVVTFDSFLTVGKHHLTIPVVIKKPLFSKKNETKFPILYTFRTFVTNGKGQTAELQSRFGLHAIDIALEQVNMVQKESFQEEKRNKATARNLLNDVEKAQNLSAANIKTAKEDVYLSMKIEQDTFKLSVKNNRLTKVAMGDFIVDVYDRKGRLLFNDARLLRIDANSQLTFYRYDLATMLQGERPSDVVIITTWKDAENLSYAVKRVFYAEPSTFDITNGR